MISILCALVIIAYVLAVGAYIAWKVLMLIGLEVARQDDEATGP